MKAENFAKLILKNCLTKSGTIKTSDFEMLFCISRYPTMTRRTFKWLSNGRYYKDTFSRDISLLEKLGVAYESGNDAPRGGKEGNYIILSVKGLNRIKPYCKEISKIVERDRNKKKSCMFNSNEELLEIIKEIAKINAK